MISLHQVLLSFGSPPLLDRVDFRLDRGERVALVGRNGSGKTTLMKVVAGELQADDGTVARSQGLRVARLVQEVPADEEGDVFEVASQGLGELRPLLRRYHQRLAALEADGSEENLEALASAQQALEAADGWSVEQRVETVLTRLGLDGAARFAHLSGGMKRRVMLARALVADPDLLLLDEPTNHLDIESVTWLEGYLASANTTLLFVTHDRVFLQALATRIVEVDRGQLASYPGDFEAYLVEREARAEVEAKERALADKKLAKEEAWLRRGVKARRARNEGRVRALQQLRRQRDQRRDRQGRATLSLQEASRSGDLVLEVEGVSKDHGEGPLFQGLDLTVHRGDRIGVLGPNGCGKSTLLSVLLGDLPPDTGQVRRGTNLEVLHFDQMRAQLDEERTVAENVVPHGDTVTIGGARKHVVGYLKDFLFPPERTRTPVRALSGGERARLLLARLFAQPANLVVMDEPTNDLDAETLELLEEKLLEYQGTLLLVSHDRAFLDNVVTSCLVFEDGTVREYVGGYSDWRRQRAALGRGADAAAPVSPEAARSAAPPTKASRPRTKLSNKERELLRTLPDRIEALEAEQETLQARMLEPDFYQQPSEAIARAQAELQRVVDETAEAYETWERLDARQ